MSKIIPRTLTDVIDKGYLEYAMYTVEARAIPSVIDGMKPVNRKLVYAMIKDHGGKKTKVADLGGISKFNYHHGEVSATDAALAMSQKWSNNVPLFEGYGNFGSRMVPATASPRYVYASLSENYKKLFSDSEVAPLSLDPENPEPKFFLPIIPFVLLNGVGGVAVGFKAEILPRSLKDVLDATKSYLKNPKKFVVANEQIKPTFPSFSGEVIQHSENQWKSVGTIDYIGKYSYKISELPIGFSRETYVTFLNELCDKELIKDYEDACSKEGFGFVVKVNANQKSIIDADPHKYFKLTKIHTELLTTLDVHGKLMIFDSVSQLIAYFCEYRLITLEAKIEYDKNELREKILHNTNKIKFIQSVVENEIDFKKTTKQELIDFIRDRITTLQHGESFIRIPLYECTKDEISKIKDQVSQFMVELSVLEETTAQKLFMTRLNSIKI